MPEKKNRVQEISSIRSAPVDGPALALAAVFAFTIYGTACAVHARIRTEAIPFIVMEMEVWVSRRPHTY